MKKRGFAAFLCGLFAVTTLSACGAPAPEADAHPDGPHIAVSMSSRDQFLSTAENAALARANELGVNCTVWDAGNDYAVQVQHVRDAVDQKYDAMIINEVNVGLTQTLLREAKGMPVVFLNRQPEMQALTAGKQVYVGSDDAEPGRYQAEWINAYAREHDLKQLRIVYFVGSEGQSATVLRKSSLVDNLEVPVEMVYESTAMYDRAKAMAQMQRLIQSECAFDLVVAQNDEMALGAVQAMLLTGAKQVTCPVLGVDGTRAGCQAIVDGQMAFTVHQPGEQQGRAAVDAALVLMQGGDLSTVEGAALSEDGLSLLIPYTPVDAARAAELLA